MFLNVAGGGQEERCAGSEQARGPACARKVHGRQRGSVLRTFVCVLGCPSLCIQGESGVAQHFATQNRQPPGGVGTGVREVDGQRTNCREECLFVGTAVDEHLHSVPLKTDLKKTTPYFAHRTSFLSLWVRRASTRVQPV